MSNPYKIDWNEYAALARQAVAEGCVLLKNDDKALPIRKGERVSVFGRIQFDYYKSGTGSGGAVNTRYVTNILDALKENKDISVNEELEQTYRDWLKDHPFEKGMGWAQEPWCQEEMPVTKELAEQAAAKSDIAVVIIGRTAGEDKDNSAAEGSYLLTAAEHQMLKEVCGAFKRVAVLLNVGNIIDMKWVKEYDPAAVLYVWQGGQEGGAGAADVLRRFIVRLPDVQSHHVHAFFSHASNQALQLTRGRGRYVSHNFANHCIHFSCLLQGSPFIPHKWQNQGTFSHISCI